MLSRAGAFLSETMFSSHVYPLAKTCLIPKQPSRHTRNDRLLICRAFLSCALRRNRRNRVLKGRTPPCIGPSENGVMHCWMCGISSSSRERSVLTFKYYSRGSNDITFS